MRENEARYRSLFEQMHDAIFILDLNGHHLAANQRAVDTLSYQKDEILNLSFRDTSAEIEHSNSVISRLLAGEHIPFYERLFRKKDGQTASRPKISKTFQTAFHHQTKRHRAGPCRQQETDRSQRRQDRSGERRRAGQR